MNETTQMILWLTVPMAINGNDCRVMAADVASAYDGEAAVRLSDGVLTVAYSHMYSADNGDVSSAILLVNESGFIDFRQNL
jgi:hypothetical protein